jgi:cobalamin synthase
MQFLLSSMWKPKDMNNVGGQQLMLSTLVFIMSLVSLFTSGLTGLALACVCAVAATAVLARYDVLISAASGGQSAPFAITVTALGIALCLASAVPYTSQPNPAEAFRIVMLTLSATAVVFAGMCFGDNILSKHVLRMRQVSATN